MLSRAAFNWGASAAVCTCAVAANIAPLRAQRSNFLHFYFIFFFVKIFIFISFVDLNFAAETVSAAQRDFFSFLSFLFYFFLYCQQHLGGFILLDHNFCYHSLWFFFFSLGMLYLFYFCYYFSGLCCCCGCCCRLVCCFGKVLQRAARCVLLSYLVGGARKRYNEMFIKVFNFYLLQIEILPISNEIGFNI